MELRVAASGCGFRQVRQQDRPEPLAVKLVRECERNLN
jgi:hypothetical protein